MAKGNMNKHRRKQFSCEPRQPEATADGRPVTDCNDRELPNSKQGPHAAAPAVEEDDAPLKSPIALGYLTVNGREEPIFAPIQGFEHLFAEEQAVASLSSQPSGQARETQETDITAHVREPSTSSPKQSRGLKRRRSRKQIEDDDVDEDEDRTYTQHIPDTFSVGDIESLKAFYAARFRELTMKPMRDIVTAWVKRLEPRRQKQYGPYQRYKYIDGANGSEIHTTSRSGRKQSTKPPWWPSDVPYVEPSHLKLQHLVPLAVDIMLIHRHIDQHVGKRKYPSWIEKLQTDAQYLVASKNTEHFSSSKGATYNEAMKKRALNVILPSLFDIAKSHEDYMAQYDLYEGSGNEDPDCGKQVSWQAAPRPNRRHIWKRPCPSSRVGSLPDGEGDYESEDGNETEVDEEMGDQGSTFSSFDSAYSYSEDVKRLPDSIEDTSLPPEVISTQTPLHAPVQTLDTVNSSNVGPSISGYGEDNKMFPEAVQDTTPALDVTSTQPVYHPMTRSSDGITSSHLGPSMNRLHLHEANASPNYPAFSVGTSTTGMLPQCSTPLHYTFAHNPQLFPSAYPIHGPSDFSTCGPVVPHDVALANGPGGHTFPSSQAFQGLPLQQIPTHGLPMVTSWNNY